MKKAGTSCFTATNRVSNCLNLFIQKDSRAKRIVPCSASRGRVAVQVSPSSGTWMQTHVPANTLRKRFKATLLCVCGMLLVSFLAGCVSEKELKKPAISSEGGTGNIDEVNVLAVPVALDLDQVPGPDGFVIKVYAGSRKRPKPFG